MWYYRYEGRSAVKKEVPVSKDRLTNALIIAIDELEKREAWDTVEEIEDLLYGK